jgi:hypothetical protein
MAQQTGEDGPICDEPAVLAAYVVDLVGALAAMARSQKLGTLGFLLDMAQLEAQAVLRRQDGNGSGH